jgi:hypothetical protein
MAGYCIALSLGRYSNLHNGLRGKHLRGTFYFGSLSISMRISAASSFSFFA